MKVCPKCQSFFDDLPLDFCRNDGIPLIEVFENENLWEKGKSFLRKSEEISKRQHRIYLTKKVLFYSVTTVIFTALIAVIVVNMVITLNPNQTEVVKYELPVSEITQSIESIKEEQETPTPTLDPIETATKPTETPNETTVKESQTPKPNLCDEATETKNIRNLHNSIWEKDIEEERSKLENEYKSLAEKFGKLDIKKTYQTKISISPECSNAGVTINFEIFAVIQGVKALIERENLKLPKFGEKKYNCQKFQKWSCQKI